MTANGEDAAPVISSSNGKARNETSPNKGEKEEEKERLEEVTTYIYPFRRCLFNGGPHDTQEISVLSHEARMQSHSKGGRVLS